MNNKEAIKIIKDNAESCNNSYLYFMHEQSQFDENAFWELYNAIRYLGFEFEEEETLPRKLTLTIVKAYEWHLLLVGFHFDKSDGIHIAHLPQNYSQYGLRLRLAIQAFLSVSAISNELENSLNDDLDNKFKIVH